MASYDLLFSGRLQKLLAVVVCLITLWVFHNLIGRSIWIDEGMVLKNIVESDGLLNYIRPLEFYNQAQPLLISFFYHFIIYAISFQIEALRTATLTFTLIISSPSLYILYKEKTGVLLPSLLFLGFSFSIGFYLTEIKHYAFEVAASFFMISVVYAYLTQKLKFSAATILIGLSTIIGFSTLIPSFVLIAFVSMLELTKERSKFFGIRNIGALVIAAFFSIITFLHIKGLTVYQINNYDVYLSKGFFGDIEALIGAAWGIHGKALIIATSLIAISGLFSDRKLLFFKFTSIYFLIIGFIVVGKLIGLYPVASPRHLVWLTPFSFILIALGLRYLSQSKNILNNIIFIFATLLVTLQGINIVYKNIQTHNYLEITNNNSLFEAVASLPPSTILVFPWARPALEYHIMLNSELKKHSYIHTSKIESRHFETKISTETRYKNSFDENFELRPAENFYYLISHFPRVLSEEKPLADSGNDRLDYFERLLLSSNCSFREIFNAKNSQILKAACND